MNTVIADDSYLTRNYSTFVLSSRLPRTFDIIFTDHASMVYAMSSLSAYPSVCLSNSCSVRTAVFSWQWFCRSPCVNKYIEIWKHRQSWLRC